MHATLFQEVHMWLKKNDDLKGRVLAALSSAGSLRWTECLKRLTE